MGLALYNEIEPFAAAWLEELIKRGAIAPGRVDRRSITELAPADVAGPGQRHFFAGIGVWSYALRLVGVPDDVSVWTGSCPCQPFSGAGKRGGVDDPRHLWPTWFGLIRECRPSVVFGEQVASPDGLAWLDVVQSDLEGAGYSVGAADLCAAGVGAPHIRQRLYFVAYADHGDIGQRLHVQPRQPRQAIVDAYGCSAAGELGHAARERLARGAGSGEVHRAKVSVAARIDGDHRAEHAGSARELADAAGGPSGLGIHDEPQGSQDVGRSSSRPRGERDAAQGTQRDAAPRGPGDSGDDRDREHARELPRDESEHGVGAAHSDHASVAAGATRGFWADAEWLPCADGVSRPVEPGTFPLAHGAPARVGRLRGFGNGLVSEQAATFIEAAIAAAGDVR